ncbi:hypothetical protein KM043_008795 [Ampulex compressa]|nr:hypothetical protein KM043_008795 [Ampulex compressa]
MPDRRCDPRWGPDAGEGEPERGKREKPKWASGQVTWRRTGPNAYRGDTLSYSWTTPPPPPLPPPPPPPLQVLSVHSGNLSGHLAEGKDEEIEGDLGEEMSDRSNTLS